MKVGDLVKYRDRLPTDPMVRDGEWGKTGIVIMITEEAFKPNKREPAVIYLDPVGDLCVARRRDLRIILK
ncbi:MAG: hypothetical protein CME70_19045 [Halobacteriovorax sp.]|nr:hypothetical protein [Halobacteriovorax sp.]|tara:strand:- start:1079 stop:1288 length:210 start_codon:yes stop_codon:yes gene_type:complete